MTEEAQHRAGLHNFLRILRRRRRLIAICVVVVPLAALGFSLGQQKRYSASAYLLFSSPDLEEQIAGASAPSNPEDPTTVTETNLRLLSLSIVADRTARQLGEGLSGSEVAKKVKVAHEGESDVASVTATASNPGLARQLADTFAEQYIAFRRGTDQTKIRQAKGVIQRRLRAVPPSEQHSAEAVSLRRQADQLDVLSNLQTGKAQLVQHAKTPSRPSSPRPLRNTAVGLLLGLILGVAVALLTDRFDRRLRDTTDVEDNLDVPILGAIPELPDTSDTTQNGRRLPHQATEGFNIVRANLRYFRAQRPIRSVLITSASVGDGKTTLALSLASAAAAAGERVLLIEADFRRPDIAASLRLQDDQGLSTLLARDAGLEDVIEKVSFPQPSHGEPLGHAFDLVLAGPPPPNPADLLDSHEMRELIEQAERTYDLVVIDTPPAALVSDGTPLVKQVSGVIVITRIGRSTREATRGLRDQLRLLDAPILGVVVNSVRPSDAPYASSAGTRHGRTPH